MFKRLYPGMMGFASVPIDEGKMANHIESMTIDEMPAGREMDALIAEKVMGWKRGKQFGNGNGEWIIDGTGFPHSPTWDCTPCFSTDIAAAWEVVEKLKTLQPRGDKKFGIKGRSPEIVLIWSGFEFECCIDGQGTYVPFQAVADTAPLAICRASLKVVSHDAI